MMNAKQLAWIVAITMLALASCVTSTSITPPPTLPPNVELNQRAIQANETAQAEYVKMLGAQRAATKAASDAQRIGAQATAAAMSTRDAIASTATRQALDEQTTRQAQVLGMTTTAQAIGATRAAEAAQYTATAHMQNIAATGTTQAIIVQATQVSGSATATANAANAQATRLSANATATVTVAQVLAAKEKADWDRRMEAFRAIASFIFIGCVLIGLAVIVGFGAIRFIDAGVLRARVLRDKTGTVFVISEKDQHGRQMILVPGRSPGAAMLIAPPSEQHLQIKAGVVDEDTTKRDQAVSLMIAATAVQPARRTDLLRELTENNQIKMVDEPPTQLVSGDVRQLLEGQWREVTDG